MNGKFQFRPYDPAKDEKTALRIWQECGWVDPNTSKKALDAYRSAINAGTADVAEYRGDAECLVTTHGGTIAMLDTDLPFRAVTGVTVGRPLRKMGAAGRLTARTVARAAAAGDAVAGLGIFDQGFYDKLGFGTFPYVRTITFDPLSLAVPKLRRPPVRLTTDDAPRIASAMAERRKGHGSVVLPQAEIAKMIMMEADKGFGLGFEDDSGDLTHFFWAEAKGENGPYVVSLTIFRDLDGLMELYSLMKNLGDQVHAFTVNEPRGLQLQDLIIRPFRARNVTKGGEFSNLMTAESFRQARILDMEAVLSALRLPVGEVRFNLELTDPIEGFLPTDSSWKGIGGEWTLALGEDGSSATRGSAPGLPVMKASVNAFTRLVFGVCPASGLAVTDDLSAPAGLLEELEAKLRLPVPDMEMIF